MGDIESQTPYRSLGRQLKNLRTRANESLAEASGAVEIDAKELASFELGKSRPAEDVLLLLISHFGAKDDEAVKLWEMAGYGMDKIPAAHVINTEPAAPVNGFDNRVLFTDIVDIVVNKYGVVMNFMQTGPGNQTTSVSRVGMSREHARSIMQILQATLSQTEQNLSSNTPHDKNSKKD